MTLAIPLVSSRRLPAQFDYALLLDFAAGENWVNRHEYAGLSSVPGYSYTRTGDKGEVDATGGIDSFAANVPGVVPDVGYWSRQQLTNYAKHSQAFDDAAWAKGGAETVTPNTHVAPDGTLSADTLTFTASADSMLYQLVDAPGPTTHSVFAKVASGTKNIRLKAFGAAVYQTSADFTLTTEWRRIVFKSTQTSVDYFYIQNGSDGTAGSVIIWQGQSVTGDLPDGGPIIPTGAAAVTVNADNLITNIKPDGSVFTDQDFIVFARVIAPPVGPTAQALNLFAEASTDIVEMGFDAGNTAFVNFFRAGGFQAQQIAGSATAAGAEVVLVAKRAAGAWRCGSYDGATLTWFAAAATLAFPNDLAKTSHGVAKGAGSHLRSKSKGSFLKLGTFSTDADVIAAINETA